MTKPWIWPWPEPPASQAWPDNGPTTKKVIVLSVPDDTRSETRPSMPVGFGIEPVDEVGIDTGRRRFSGFVGGIVSPPSENPGAATLADILKKRGARAHTHATQVEACAGITADEDLDD